MNRTHIKPISIDKKKPTREALKDKNFNILNHKIHNQDNNDLKNKRLGNIMGKFLI